MFEFGRENPVLLWKPVVELDFGQERFLTDDPSVLFSLGRFERVPILSGITKYEFLYPAISEYELLINCLRCGFNFHPIISAIIGNKDLRQEMDANFTKVAPICFLYERGSNWSAQISKELREQFLSGPILDNESLPELNNVNE